VPACAAVKELRGTSADPKPAALAALMKSLLVRILSSPDMFDVSFQWIDFGSDFKSLGLVTMEGILRSYLPDMIKSINSTCSKGIKSATYESGQASSACLPIRQVDAGAISRSKGLITEKKRREKHIGNGLLALC
jgi:hypothetical protein